MNKIMNIPPGNVRAVILVLIIAALVGPWWYETDGVPPPEWCEPPFVLIAQGQEGVFTCAIKMTGIELVTGEGYLLYQLEQAISYGISMENFGIVLLFFALLLIFVLPAFSTLLLMIGGERRWMKILNRAAWITTLLMVLYYALAFILQRIAFLSVIQLWGFWLYILLGIASLAWERTSSNNKQHETARLSVTKP
jgi:hypothetical protein